MNERTPEELECLEGYEIFQAADYELTDEDGTPMPDGWYWWSCQRGCLPDGDPVGPFETEYAAEEDILEPLRQS